MPGLKITLSTGESSRKLRDLKKDLEALGSGAVNNEKQFKQLSDRLGDGLKADKAKAAVDRLDKSLNLTRIETAKLKAGIGDYSGALSAMTSGTGSAVKNIALLGTVMSAVALGGVALIGKGFLETAKTFERFETQLKTITGSSAKAESAMAWITEFTSKTPYELDQVTDSFIKMKSYGLDATKWMGTLGNTSAAMGKSLNQAVEMFADAAVGEFERLKEFGIKASKQGDDVTFKWSENGKDMVKTAKSTQSGITDALGDIFSRFDGSMDDLSKTWEGMMSNLSDKWTMFQKEVTDGGPFKAMKASLKAFLDYLETNDGKMDLKTWAQETAQVTVESFIYMAKGLDVFLSGIRTTQALYAGFVSQIKKWNTEGLKDALDNANAAIDSGFNVELNKEIRNGLIVKIALLNKERAAWDEIGVNSLIASDKTKAGIKTVTDEMASWLKASSDTKGEIDGLGESLNNLGKKGGSGAGAGVLSLLDIANVESFYTDYDNVTLSSFEIQEKALEASYEYRLKLAEEDAISKLDLEDWYFIEWLKIQDARILKETEKRDKATKERAAAAKEEADALKEIQDMKYNMIQDLGGSDYFEEQIEAIKDYAKTYIDLSGDIVTAEAWKNNEIQKLNAETALKDIESREDSFSSIESSLSSIAGLYEEGSSAQQAASVAANVAYAAEMAMLVQRNLMLAVGAVVNQGSSGDVYTAIPRMAAMAAAVAGILSIANIDFSGGGVSGGDLGTEQRVGLVSGSGTVLGDSTELSESFGNSMAFLEDIGADQYSTLVDIFYEMQDLNSNITGLATSIVRDYGGFSADSLGISEGYTQTDIESFFSEAESIAGDFFNIAGDLGTAWISETVTGWVGDLASNIFGGGVSQKLAGAGIYVAPWSQSEGSPTYWKEKNIGGKDPNFYKYESDERMSEAYVKIYETIKSKEDGGWVGSDSTYYDTDFTDANKDTVTYFAKVLTSFVDLAQGFSDELGVSSQSEISDYTFEIGRINLQDLEGDEITDAIEGVFSEVGDEMIEDLFGDSIKKYQEINEGLFETAIRLVTVKNAVTESFGKIGIAFNLTSAEAVAVSQDIISMSGDISDFQQNFKSFYESFYSTADVQSNFKELAESSLKSIDGSISFPETKKVFKELVSSIDITSESGVKLYTTLMSLADGANEFYEYLEEIKNFNDDINDIIFDNTMSDYGKELLALNRWYEEQVSTAVDLGISLEKINEAYRYQLDSINKTSLSEYLEAADSDFETAKSQYISALNLEINKNETIFDQLQDEIDLKNDLIDKNEDLLDSFRDLKDNISEFQSDLVMSSTSTSPEYQLAYAKSMLDETVRGLYSTDQSEVEAALKNLPGVSQEYLDLSQKMNVNELDQIKALGYVQEILNTSQGIANVQIDKTEDTLYGLYAQNTILTENQAYYQTQIDSLGAILEEISGTNNLLTMSLEQAKQQYVDAQKTLDTATSDYNTATQGDSTKTLDDTVRSSYETLVKQTYMSELGREGKPAGIDYWVNSLMDDSDPVDLSNFKEAFRNAAVEQGELSIVGSGIDYESIVKNMYWSKLGRAGKPAGIDYWVNSLIDPTDSVDLSNFEEAFLNAALASGEIPAFADGGTVYKPTFSLIGEGGQAEHVTPDSQMQGVKNRLDKIYEVLWTMLNLSGDKKESMEDLLDIFDRNTMGNLPFKTEAA